MKNIKKFSHFELPNKILVGKNENIENEPESMDELSIEILNPNWSKFTKWAHSELFKMFDEIKYDFEELVPYMDDIKVFFSDMEDEYLDANTWDIYEVYYIEDDDRLERNYVRGHGKIHSIFKVILDKKYPEYLLVDMASNVIDEDDLRRRFNEMNDTLLKIKKVLDE